MVVRSLAQPHVSPWYFPQHEREVFRGGCRGVGDESPTEERTTGFENVLHAFRVVDGCRVVAHILGRRRAAGRLRGPLNELAKRRFNLVLYDGIKRRDCAGNPPFGRKNMWRGATG